MSETAVEVTEESPMSPEEKYLIEVAQRNPRVAAFIEATRPILADIPDPKIRFAKHKLMTEEAIKLAMVDGMTGLLNKEGFMDRMGQMIEEMRRLNVPMAVLIIDLDKFKDLNDSQGHPAGDEALINISARLKQLRMSDVSGRVGGDELAVLLPGVAQGAVIPADRIRREIARIAPELTASIGVAVLGANDNAADIYDRADQGTFWSKHNGRDQISVVTLPGQNLTNSQNIARVNMIPPEAGRAPVAKGR